MKRTPAYVRTIAVVLITFALAALIALLVPTPARADLYYSDSDGDTVHVTEKPCPAEIAIHAPEGMRGYLRLTYAHIGEDSGVACAMPATHKQRQGPQMFILFPNKSFWLIDLLAFQPEPIRNDV